MLIQKAIGACMLCIPEKDLMIEHDNKMKKYKRTLFQRIKSRQIK